MISIFYGSETGNAEDCARELLQAVRAAGFSARVEDMFSFKHAKLVDERLALAICSTFGHGEPPSGAEPFFSISEKP
jgi:sulfite reductase (NADPH) flavoprotein alpha-component